MGYKYAQSGPPFNFLGNMSESQQAAFVGWLNQQAESLPQVQTFHQVRAQQLRKTAGMLEQFYASGPAPDKLAPTFIKPAWKPGADGYFPYAQRNDHAPAMVVGNLKRHFRSHLVHMDDAVFYMNQVRTQIERHEDQAQHAFDGITKVPALINQLSTLFGKPEYQGALVKDQSDLYEGEPRYRVSQFDDPTPWERQTRTGVSPSS